MASLLQSLTSWLPGGGINASPVAIDQDDISISDLWIFPIKSCRGIRVESANVLPRGLQFDREFVIVEEQSHRFLTARTIPMMILIETSIDFDRQLLTIKIPATETGQPSSTHTVSLARPDPESFAGEVLNDVSIWAHRGLDGYSVGSDELRAALSAYMRRPVLLVQKGQDERSVNPEHIASLPHPEFKYGEGDEAQVSWADEYPVLFTSKRSLAELDRRVRNDTTVHESSGARFNRQRWLDSGKGIEMVRFRGNVVLDGVAVPWDEDSWAEVEIGHDSIPFLVAQRCARCQLPSVDPDTAIRDPVTPDAFMQDRHQMKSVPHKVCFGVQTVPINELSHIRVGDKVRVTRKWTEKRADGTPIRPEDKLDDDDEATET